MQNSTMTQKNIAAEQQQIIRGMLHIVVLAELAKKRQYGAELLIGLSETPFSSKVGTLYPLLNRLEKDGLLISEWQMTTGQTPRKYYQISVKGREKLAEYRQFMTDVYKQIGGVA